MNRLFSPLALLLFLTGCAASSIHVIEKKETPRPFSKILAIYIDGDVEFPVFDSTSYNICIKSCFSDSAHFDVRSSAEDLLYDALSAPRSQILESSNLFDIYINSYTDFTNRLDSLGVDALLIVHLRHYTYTEHALPGVRDRISHSTTLEGGGSYRTPNAVFECYLIKPHTYFPVWKASLDVKGKGYYNGKGALKTGMVRQLEKSLVSGGYIVPHR